MLNKMFLFNKLSFWYGLVYAGMIGGMGEIFNFCRTQGGSMKKAFIVDDEKNISKHLVKSGPES